MKDFTLTMGNREQLFEILNKELKESGSLVVTTQKPGTGKWGMARLWRLWMESTASYMAANGVTMPLMYAATGKPYGKRPFNRDDAHELFTHQWLGADAEGMRLSWSKQGRDGMRPATKAERFHAMLKHEIWASERGINLFVPRDSEYWKTKQEQEQ